VQVFGGAERAARKIINVKEAINRAGCNEHQRRTATGRYCIIDVIGDLAGKNGALFGVRFCMWLKLRARMGGAAMAFACGAGHISHPCLGGKRNMRMREVDQFGEGVVGTIARERKS